MRGSGNGNEVGKLSLRYFGMEKLTEMEWIMYGVKKQNVRATKVLVCLQVQ